MTPLTPEELARIEECRDAAERGSYPESAAHHLARVHVPALVAALRELLAPPEGCEETVDGERVYDTEPCSRPGCELCLCPCGLPRSDAYHTPEQRAACREAFGGVAEAGDG